MVPHITDAIQEWIERVAKIPVDGKDGQPDVCVIELGGTIGKIYICICTDSSMENPTLLNWGNKTKIYTCAGDIESRPFIEALSQFSYRVGKFIISS